MINFLFHTDLRYRISRHILFFMLIVLIFSLALYSRSANQYFLPFLKLTFINAFIFLGYGYLTIFVLIPAFLPDRKFFWFGLLFVLSGFLLSVIKLSISDFIFYSLFSPEIESSKGLLNVRYVFINTKDMSFIVGLLVIAKFTKDWLLVEKQHLALLKKYEELNLRVLQSHFEPHFLFNTLNNLYALSLSKSDKTLDVIRKFKRVLRFSIKEAQLNKVPLSNEIELIRDFIEIEQIRYGERLQISYVITGNFEHLQIAPFLLFSLVENCFKHGSSIDAGNPWISLTLSCDNGFIWFVAKNSVPDKYRITDAFQEKGLAKLRKRLDLIYPGKHILRLNEELKEFTVRLELNLN